jgi:hypothetical protein
MAGFTKVVFDSDNEEGTIVECSKCHQTACFCTHLPLERRDEKNKKKKKKKKKKKNATEVDEEKKETQNNTTEVDEEQKQNKTKKKKKNTATEVDEEKKETQDNTTEVDEEQIRTKNKKKKKKKSNKKRKHEDEATEDNADRKHAKRSYSCVWCTTQPIYETTDPILYSNHVRMCKTKHTTTTVSDCLQGTVVALSLWSKPGADAAVTFDEKDLRGKLISLGATFSNTIHKKVKVLLATSDACRRGTQRVRKAWKKKIPILLPEWLEACVANKRAVDRDGYTLSYVGGGDNSSSSSSSSSSRSAVADNNEEAGATKDLTSKACMDHVQHFDFGCCCGCHDSEPPLLTCEWCPECYV